MRETKYLNLQQKKIMKNRLGCALRRIIAIIQTFGLNEIGIRQIMSMNENTAFLTLCRVHVREVNISCQGIKGSRL